MKTDLKSYIARARFAVAMHRIFGRTLRYLWIASCVSCVACSGDPYAVDISTLTPEQQAAAEGTFATWCEAYSDQCLHSDPDGGSEIVTATLILGRSDVYGAVLPNFGFGSTCGECSTIQVRSDVDDAAFRRILAHEVGHLLGCVAEGSEPDHVMYGRVVGGTTPTDKDVQCVRENWRYWK